MTGPTPGFLPPPVPPAPVRNARYCWLALLVLYLAIVAFNLIGNLTSDTAGGSSGTLPVALGVFGLVGVRKLAAGNRSGRTLATVMGGLLAAAQVFSLVLLAFIPDLGPGLVILNVVTAVLTFGLIAAAIVLMFRPEVTVFLRPGD